MKIGITWGKYQPFHKGHEMYINNMTNSCDMLFVVVFGESVKKSMPNDIVAKKISQALKEDNVVAITARQLNIATGFFATIVYSICNEYFDGKYKNDDIIIFAGDDRQEMYKQQITKFDQNAAAVSESIGLIRTVDSFHDFLNLIGAKNISIKVPEGKNDIKLGAKEQALIAKLNIKINKGSNGRVSGSLIRGLASLPKDVFDSNKKSILSLFEKCVSTNSTSLEQDYLKYRKYYGV